MFGGRFTIFEDTTPVVKNLILMNVVVFIASTVLDRLYGDVVTANLTLFYFKSPLFKPFQYVTHMFMHANFGHLFFNMFALWMFGKVLESVWGSKRFLIYYMITGMGAAAFYTFVNYLQYSPIESAILAFRNTPSPDLYAEIMRKYFSGEDSDLSLMTRWISDPQNSTYISQGFQKLVLSYSHLVNIPMLGASGAVFGILLAFGMLFPNTELMLLFLPIPIKAKWFVLGYGAMELFFGLTGIESGVAHFAHLGGMLFGFILIKYWNTKRTNFY
jgi:membrane associated rhomboid family serine protease